MLYIEDNILLNSNTKLTTKIVTMQYKQIVMHMIIKQHAKIRERWIIMENSETEMTAVFALGTKRTFLSMKETTNGIVVP